MSPSDIDEFLLQVDERCKQAGDLFKVDMSDLGSPSDLMAEANEQLAQLALKAGRPVRISDLSVNYRELTTAGATVLGA
jgi:hypothetical protein